MALDALAIETVVVLVLVVAGVVEVSVYVSVHVQVLVLLQAAKIAAEATNTKEKVIIFFILINNFILV